jgi:subtilase family serine protease
MHSRLLGSILAVLLGSSAYAIDGANLVVTRIESPPVSNTYEPTTIVATVKNVGNAPTQGTVYVTVYFSTDAVITADDVAWGNGFFTTFQPGQEKSVVMTTTGEWPGPGRYWVGAMVDGPDGYGGSQVPETNENDNTLLGGEITVTQPDVTITGMTGPTTVQAGQTVTVVARVKNVGDGRTSGAAAPTGFYLALYLTDDAIVTECDDAGSDCDLQEAVAWVDVLQGGEERDVAITFTARVPGAIGLVADSGNLVYERSEANNTLVPAFPAP